MLIVVFSVLITLTFFHESLCYSYGAPTSQCTSMTPNHGVVAQAGASPYNIKLNKPYYMPGENVRVTIESSGDDIRGFLIQARQVGGNSAIGMFATVPANGQYRNCGNSKGAVTHSTTLSVKTVNFEWEPSISFTGNITFFATVVKDKNTFWVKLQSPELYKKEMHQNATRNTSPSTTLSTAATTQTANTSTAMSTAPTTLATNESLSTAVTTSTTDMCKPNDTTCDGIQLNHNVFLFFVGLFLAFWQNAI